MSQQCGICGDSGRRIGGGPCAICGIHVCDAHPRTTASINQDLVIYIMGQAPDCVQKKAIVSASNSGQKPLYGLPMCPNCFGWIDYWSKDLYTIQTAVQRRYNKERHMELAQKFERAGRFEDAAKEYEKAEEWDDAGRVRREGSTSVVKSVSVDLNRLLDDLRRGGLALNYRCHACGAGITIGSAGFDAPKFCPYCGVMIEWERCPIC
jgi:hypothetical protein